MIYTKLEKYIFKFKEELNQLTRKEGTAFLTELIIKFSQENNLKVRQEVPIVYDGTKSGRLDFVLYHDTGIYPIEIDTSHRNKSVRKLLCSKQQKNHFPIWLRWDYRSEKDTNIKDIFIIDITKEPIARLKEHIQLDLATKMPFGIYKDLELRNIIINNPKYIVWCVNNISLYQLSRPAAAFLEEILKIRCKDK